MRDLRADVRISSASDVRATTDRLRKGGVEEGSADVATACGLGDHQVRDPRLRRGREERMAELETHEANGVPFKQREA